MRIFIYIYIYTHVHALGPYLHNQVLLHLKIHEHIHRHINLSCHVEHMVHYVCLLIYLFQEAKGIAICRCVSYDLSYADVCHSHMQMCCYVQMCVICRCVVCANMLMFRKLTLSSNTSTSARRSAASHTYNQSRFPRFPRHSDQSGYPMLPHCTQGQEPP
jgi:hypothetical protein